jgi:hypothetical protein
MSKFSELLAMPLPSKRNTVVNESEDVVTVDDKDLENLTDEEKEALAKKEEGCANESDIEDEEINDISLDDISDFDADDLSDEELAELDKDLGGEALDTVAGVDDTDEEHLSPDEEIEADDMMSVAATSMLVNDELNTEEKTSFVSNESEVTTVINEGFMTESDINSIANDCNLIQEANNYNQKMIIRLNAEAKKKQLYAVAVNVSAAAHNDPDYRKLRKVMHARKILRERLAKKYHVEAMKRMKIYFKRLRSSRSSVLKKIADKVAR